MAKTSAPARRSRPGALTRLVACPDRIYADRLLVKSFWVRLKE